MIAELRFLQLPKIMHKLKYQSYIERVRVIRPVPTSTGVISFH